MTAYVAGLRDEGCEVPEAQVRRGHALCLLLMTGLSTAPFDLFEGPINAETQPDRGRPRALARYALDLLEATSARAG